MNKQRLSHDKYDTLPPDVVFRHGRIIFRWQSSVHPSRCSSRQEIDAYIQLMTLWIQCANYENLFLWFSRRYIDTLGLPIILDSFWWDSMIQLQNSKRQELLAHIQRINGRYLIDQIPQCYLHYHPESPYLDILKGDRVFRYKLNLNGLVCWDPVWEWGKWSEPYPYTLCRETWVKRLFSLLGKFKNICSKIF